MITVNGLKREDIIDLKLTEFLSKEGYETSKIAVELNGDIIKKSDYPNIILKENDTLEVVSFVGGG